MNLHWSNDHSFILIFRRQHMMIIIYILKLIWALCLWIVKRIHNGVFRHLYSFCVSFTWDASFVRGCGPCSRARRDRGTRSTTKELRQWSLVCWQGFLLEQA